MADKIQIRRDTAANWTSSNPILSAGEMGYETDTKILRVGDGVTAFTSLPAYRSPVRRLTLTADAGGSGSVGAWTKRVFDAAPVNTIIGASVDLGTSRFTLPAGTYDIEGWAAFWKGSGTNVRVYSVTGETALLYGATGHSLATSPPANTVSPIAGRIVLAATTTLEMQYYALNTVDLGNGAVGGGATVAAMLTVTLG